MSIDWKLLAQVRDRHKLVAQERVAHERRLAEQHRQSLRQAQAQLQAQLDAKSALWQQTISGERAFSVADLRQASAWSSALDSHIASAGESVREAAQHAAQQQARLDDSRRLLRAAAGELEKAEQMRSRTHAQQLQRLEARLEDAADEAAAQAWAARRAS